MNCPNCGRDIPADSNICPYCGARVLETATQDRPAMGPTTRLGPDNQLDRPASAAPSYTPQPPVRSRPSFGSRQAVPIGAVWLIGMGILFFTNTIWPGVLLLVGLTSYLSMGNRGRPEQALSPLFFFTGLAVLFYTNWFWPGILILIGIMMLVNAGSLRRLGR